MSIRNNRRQRRETMEQNEHDLTVPLRARLIKTMTYKDYTRLARCCGE
ncbi:MAG: hypothetical protein ONB46_24770 [candidate division KSB1 bacterium]|nr:hypothetical protein [candidate division KSB1 bacterium]MDZ7369097.1 hypothetical protein [candidate division KSB1 bacterium]